LLLAAACAGGEGDRPPFDAAAAESLVHEAWRCGIRIPADLNGPRLDQLERGEFAMLSFYRGGCYSAGQVQVVVAGGPDGPAWIRGYWNWRGHDPEDGSSQIATVPWGRLDLGPSPLSDLQDILDAYRVPESAWAPTSASVQVYWKLRDRTPWMEHFTRYALQGMGLSLRAAAEAAGAFRAPGS